MKKYETPELLLTCYEVDEQLAALNISGPAGDNITDKDSWENMFGGNN